MLNTFRTKISDENKEKETEKMNVDVSKQNNTKYVTF